MRRVLVVGMPNSIHIARFCASISRTEWSVLLFPCHDAEPHPELTDVVLLDPSGAISSAVPKNYQLRKVFPWSASAARSRLRAASLAAVIARVRPDIVHAQELQHGAYLAVAARRLVPRFPPLIASIWGSDMSLRVRLPEERTRIVRTLQHIDMLTAECERDLRTARALGYSGETVLPLAVAGGLDISQLNTLRAPGLTSERRTIAVKGYQGWAGRSQVALRAIERCSDLLSGYRISMYLANPDSAILARRLGVERSLDVEVVSTGRGELPHREMLALHGRSRISLGLSYADGISTSFLEAIAMGSFPIQSRTACIDEWITDGEGGFIVPPDDPDSVATAMRVALTDDARVDRAAIVNASVVQRRLDGAYVRAQVMTLYDRIAAGQIVRADRRTRVAGIRHQEEVK